MQSSALRARLGFSLASARLIDRGDVTVPVNGDSVVLPPDSGGAIRDRHRLETELTETERRRFGNRAGGSYGGGVSRDW
jgi:hypothetical protein